MKLRLTQHSHNTAGPWHMSSLLSTLHLSSFRLNWICAIIHFSDHLNQVLCSEKQGLRETGSCKKKDETVKMSKRRERAPGASLEQGLSSSISHCYLGSQGLANGVWMAHTVTQCVLMYLQPWAHHPFQPPPAIDSHRPQLCSPFSPSLSPSKSV